MQIVQRSALLRLGSEREIDRSRKRAGQVSAPALQWCELSADAPRGGGRRRPAHGIHAGEALVQNERQRVQVGGLSGLSPLALLGRHVGERAKHVSGARERVFTGQPRPAEVGQLGHPAALVGMVGNEHVLRLDVTVDHAARVCMGERIGKRKTDLEQILISERACCDQRREGLPVDQLGDQVEGVLTRARLVQGNDRRVRQTRGGERLAGCPLAVDRIPDPPRSRPA